MKNQTTIVNSKENLPVPQGGQAGRSRPALKIVCYGLGIGFDFMIGYLDRTYAEVVGLIDQKLASETTVEKFGVTYPVLKIEDLGETQFDYVIICSETYRNEMMHILLDAAVPPEKIMVALNCFPASPKTALDYSYQDYDYSLLNRAFPGLLHGMCVPHTIRGPELPLRDPKDRKNEYVRKLTLFRIMEKIQSRHVEGSCAEVGVLQGDFAKVINELFPERDLYLFDTFEGFDPRDVKTEAQYMLSSVNQYHEFIKTISSEEFVLSRMPFREKCHIRKGYFPQTAEGLPSDLRFALVSLDVDLYQPTMAGLEFFYPRMSPGGVIMIHDCNIGAGKAVDKFAVKNSIFPIPVGDTYDSEIIVHP